jgi:hypothetical protein
MDHRVKPGGDEVKELAMAHIRFDFGSLTLDAELLDTRPRKRSRRRCRLRARR